MIATFLMIFSLIAPGLAGAETSGNNSASAERGAVEVTTAASGSTDQARTKARKKGTYLIQMALDPVVTYDGGVKGLKPTRPHKGSKMNPAAQEVEDYAEHLRGRQRAALTKVNGGSPIYNYVYTYNGFTAQLTGDQATKLAEQPEVLAVHEDVLHEINTASTPSFLGLDDEDGLWEHLGGPNGGRKVPGAGEDIVIGVIDSGIWPEASSFSDRDENGKRTYLGRPKDSRGTCASAETVGDDSWDANLCNSKLVTAQYFNAGWGGNDVLKETRPWEFLSPRDYNGHGTHTASTAAGNHGVDVTGPAEVFGEISGIAPRARIAAYKALWSTEDGSTANGYTSDLLAAIESAVADGVDVINYSVSGTSTDFLDPVEVAFLNAANVGVFVSASAGNSGPSTSTVAHPSPWVTTVAAGTHNRVTTGTVTLGNGKSYTGASAAASAVGPVPLISGRDAALDGANKNLAARCYADIDNGGKPVLDPAKVEGNIVLCERGGSTARINKSLAVADAGGVGMILVNAYENTLNSDFHAVPTLHLADSALAELKAYAATNGATATISAARIEDGAEAPYIAEFSSRGPLVAGGGDVLKPDLIAPGQDILAAVAPPGQGGMEYNLMSGTSMSAPHVAGLAALLRDLHPDWSPMMIKSALMTTGSNVLDGDANDPSVTFGQGAGHVQPNDATDPGLVYESNAEDWLAFLCGSTQGVDEAVCDNLKQSGHSLDPSDMNTPSIAIGLLDGTQTVTRTVTNVGETKATYTASVTGLKGVDVKVEPSTLTIEPGKSASFSVTFTLTDAEEFTYNGGQLSWADGTHTVRSPIVLRARQAGDEEWAARYDGERGQFGTSKDSGEELLLHPEGKRVYMNGTSAPPVAGGLVTDILTAAYDPDSGEELWSVQWDGSEGGSDEPGGFGMSPDGDTLYIAGTSGGDAVLMALNGATGEELWQVRQDGPGAASDVLKDIVVSPDGSTLYVTGYSNMGGTQLDYATAAYDAATGAQRWLSYYDDEVEGTDDARAIAVSADGGTVVITGQSAGEGTGLTDWGTVAYDAATGKQIWDVLHNGSQGRIDVADSVAIVGDTVIVAGAVSNLNAQTDWHTVGYDLATGEQRWVSEYGGSGTDVPRAVAPTPDASTVVVTGNVDGTNMDYATIAYDVATGEELWVSVHNGTANGLDIAWDVTVTEDGTRAVVTGESTDTATRSDYFTIAYDLENGEKVWSAAYDATAAPDGASAVAVDARKRVFVTGSSNSSLDKEFGLDSNFDAATVAYLEPLE